MREPTVRFAASSCKLVAMDQGDVTFNGDSAHGSSPTRPDKH